MRFGVLGPLRVERDGEVVAVGGPKQRDLLALLVLRANRFLSADWLVDALWDGRPPASAHVTLRTYVAGLRRALEPGRGQRVPGEVLRGHTGGYELHVPPGAVDAVRFAELADAGARALAGGDPVAAERWCGEALGLWRGEVPVAGLAAVRPDVARLAEARLTAWECRFTAAVASGGHRAALPELRRFVAAHPDREHARAQLMLALYRAGRQAEALAVFDEGRRLLVEEYGVEPGEELRSLHRQVLDHAVPPPDVELAVSGWRTRGAGVEDTRGVGGVSSGGAPRVARSARLVGRSAELAVLDDQLAAAVGGGGRCVAVVGEAGIGKTSLARAVAERAGRVPVVWGHCPDLGQAPPFWLWSQVVRALAPGADDPALAGFSGGPRSGPVDPAARFRAYEAVAELIRSAAEPAGLVLVLDDLHAADPDSLLLLRYVATGLPTTRALVVATLRPYEHDPALVATLADLARGPGFRQVRPAGLAAPAVAELVLARTGARPADGVVDGLVARTGGNPFFITELLASPGDEPPPGVRDAVRLRLNALDGATRERVDLLAVAGREVDVAVLGAGTGWLAGVGHLVVETGPGAVRFRHPLFAEVVYAELGPTRRASLHGRLADAGRGVLSPAELAHHYGRARGREAEHLRWTLEAAEDATRRLAYEDALAHLDRAAGLTGGAAELAVQLKRVSLLQITVGVGSDAVDRAAARARELLAEWGRGTAGFSDAGLSAVRAAAAEAGSSTALGADPRLALWTLGELACNRAEFDIARELAVRLVEAEGGAGDGGVTGVAGRYLLGVAAYFTGRLAEADELLTAAVERLDARSLVGRTGRTPALATYDFRALVRSLRGDADAARRDLRAAHDLAERTGDPYGRANAALFAGWAALQEHDVVGGREAGLRCRELGAGQNMPHFVTVGDFLVEWAVVRGGDDSRLAAMRAAADGIYRLGLRSTRTITMAAVADAHLAVGRFEEAARLAGEGLAAAAAVGERVLLAELHRVRGVALGDREELVLGAGIAVGQGARLLAARF
ncbi:AfsR/SARP family transcriptional regulator [Saccharothrix syringae]|uniref:Transcriptional regulator n=1 Tax=Saccharothrix syringae TaxID=103733 RepID=A0A5Q0H1A3_SACSY|nr:AfsR/SARP family transcriptional regulator [Saccharothrix syringae]QFZ19452.1 transcriptional regulator [Saccharothrix syringae]